ASVAHAGFPRAVPQVAARGRSDRELAFGWVGEFAWVIMAIIERPHFLDEIRRIGGHAPFVAIGADLALDIKIVEQYKLLRQLVVIGSDPLRKQAKLRVTIALRHVAEDLIVRAIFLDDINAVLDRRRIARYCGDRIVGWARGAGRSMGAQRTGAIGQGRVGG